MTKLIKFNLPTVIKTLVKRLSRQTGVNIFLVGGAIRDKLLNQDTKDFDLVVSGLPSKKLENELKKLGKIIFVGKTFGVYKLVPKNWTEEPIDIALPRLDHSLNTGRYRDVKIKSDYHLSITDDLKRRDFTINALAVNLITGELIDGAFGLKHLNNKIITTVGHPETRFKEDYSRIFRALRFAIQLGFKIETKTWRTITTMGKRAVTEKVQGEWKLPREIIAREFLKSLTINPTETIKLWDKADLIKIIFPEITALKTTPQAKIFHSEGNVFVHTLLALQAFTSPDWKKFFPHHSPSISVILALLLHDIGKPITMKWVTKNGKKIVTTPEHDIKGAALTRNIINRLKLTSYSEKGNHIDADLVEWLVLKHMLLVHGRVEDFKPSTIYRYFFFKPNWGLALQQVIFADSWATRPADGRILFDRLTALKKRIKKLTPLLNKQGELSLLLNGNDLIKIFNLQPGPQIGKLLKLLTDAQLSQVVKNKKQATVYLKKFL